MGNILLMRFVILLYIVVCIIFCLSPYLNGKDKRFGIKVDKKSKSTVLFSVSYLVTAIALSVAFAIMCIFKNSFLFVNLSVLMYIVFMSLIYFKIRHRLKSMFDPNIFREIILNNPPETFMVKMINPLFYILYLLPVIFTIFVGDFDGLSAKLLVIQIVVTILSFLLNVAICKLKIYIDDNIEKSVKNNIKYRKMLNVNCFVSLFALSVSITVMNAEYKGVINTGGISEWLPFGVVGTAFGVLLFCSFKYNKK